MPPQQCPECGRFLKNAFVQSLTTEPTPCPRCETDLVAAMFGLEAPQPGTVETAGADAPAAAHAADAADAADAAEPSVRPPDLQPTQVRDEPAGVLEGWDRGVGPAPLVDRAPFPMDAVVLAGAGLVGGVLGSLFGERGCRGAVLGAAGGVLGAAVARRVWRLE